MKNPVRREPKRPQWVQAPSHEEFTGGRLDKEGKFTPPTPEQERQMNERLSRLGEVMGEAEFPWLLDGALNISLYGEDFIRYHKDLDLTVFRQDVGKLMERLQAQGLAIAVSKHAPGKKVLFRLATPTDFKDTSRISLGIVAVDERGQIDMSSTDPLHNADLHLHDQDPQGNIMLENVGVTLPKKYLTPQLKRLPSGAEVRLSHPVLVAFHKLHQERSYDEPDLLRLHPRLSKEDVEFLRSALQTEMNHSLEKAKQFLVDLHQRLQLIADQGPAAVAARVKAEPLIRGRLREPNVREFVDETTRIFATQPQVTVEEYTEQVIRLHKDSSLLKRKLEFLQEW